MTNDVKSSKMLEGVASTQLENAYLAMGDAGRESELFMSGQE